MSGKQHSVEMTPIGTVEVRAREIPRHWSVSKVEGQLILNELYQEGLKDIQPGQRIAVIFHFHLSPAFSATALSQTPPHGERDLGIFSICSPVRPNPLGLSVLEVLEVKDNRIRVRGLDMQDGTPILDIKPHVE
jgi:tRNA-Thr(GGU) m(6)t(6)A37 methyltransferase TsaA